MRSLLQASFADGQDFDSQRSATFHNSPLWCCGAAARLYLQGKIDDKACLA